MHGLFRRFSSLKASEFAAHLTLILLLCACYEIAVGLLISLCEVDVKDVTGLR
jgi:hypothetical protein